MKYAKKWENVTQRQKIKKRSIELEPEMVQMLGITDNCNNVKRIKVNVFKTKRKHGLNE